MYFTGGLLFKRLRRKSGLFLACIMPTLVASQIITTFTIGKIQRFRSDLLIAEIESTPTTLTDSRGGFGIEVVKDVDSGSFKISYSRGFMVKEVYDSRVKSWKSLGWND